MPIRVVLLDDHPMVLKGLEQLLRAEPDFQVLATCGSVEEGLEAVHSLDPDVLVLDLKLREDDDLGEILLPPRSGGEKKPPPEKAQKEERKRHPRPQKQPAEDADDEHERPHRAPRANANFILVNAADAEETRVAVVEDGRIVDFQMTVKTHKTFVNDIYRGKVVSIKEFGAFVEVLPGQDGLVHISELADFRVKATEDVVKLGDVIWVKCIGVDDKGRVRLSRKAAMAERAKELESKTK